MHTGFTLRFFAGLAVIAAMAITSVHAGESSSNDDPTGVIRVQVADTNGKRIEGARVVLTHRATGAQTDEQFTGMDGTTLFSDLEPGRYMISAAHPDVGRGERRAWVIRFRKTRVSVVLR